MNCIVTAGPTFEPLDAVRRITNFSTGKLGIELANFLTGRGHDVTLLAGEQATFTGERRATRVRSFSTTANLREELIAFRGQNITAVFHAAAVSDFAFGAVWRRSPTGEMNRIKAGKISTRDGALLAELVPTPKLINELREWFPHARLAGWKFEVDGGRDNALQAARNQLADTGTDLCVANGPAYGNGFGLVTKDGHRTVESIQALYEELEKFAQA